MITTTCLEGLMNGEGRGNTEKGMGKGKHGKKDEGRGTKTKDHGLGRRNERMTDER